jgi:hypothetical protein
MVRPYFSAGTLDRMRRTDERAMPDTAQIQASTIIDDGAGGSEPGWSTTATVPCRVTALTRSDAERVIADVQMTRPIYQISIPLGTAVADDNRVLVGSRSFGILAIINGSYNTSRALICAEDT